MRPTWPVMVPTSNLVKVFLTLVDSVIGTERHESRRIDNQLRGRAGRQGDPGNLNSTFREDELMRRFGSDRIKQVLERLNADEKILLSNHVC
ncbi:MAG: hypothetical protein ACLS5G_01045 [Streptococcus sp.]